MIRFVVAAILAGMLVLSGCKTVDMEREISPLDNMPDTFSNSMGMEGLGKSDTTENWWTFFNSDELTSLIDEALNNNFDLTTQRTKIIQEEARLKKEEAGFFPSLGFSLGGTRKETQVKKSSNTSSTRAVMLNDGNRSAFA